MILLQYQFYKRDRLNLHHVSQLIAYKSLYLVKTQLESACFSIELNIFHY